MKIIVHTIKQGDEIKYMSLDEKLRDAKMCEVATKLDGPHKTGEFILNVEATQEEALAKLSAVERFALSIPSLAIAASQVHIFADIFPASFGHSVKNKVYDKL